MDFYTHVRTVLIEYYLFFNSKAKLSNRNAADITRWLLIHIVALLSASKRLSVLIFYVKALLQHIYYYGKHSNKVP